MPLRPSLPPLGWAVAALWLGIACAEAASWHDVAGGGGYVAACWVAVALAGLGGVALARSGRSAAALSAMGIAAGLALGCLWWVNWAADGSALTEAGSRRWRLEIMADETPGRFGSSSEARVLGAPGGGALVKVEWPKGCAPPALGGEVEVLGGVSAVAADEWGRRSHQAGLVGKLRARDVRRIGWARSMRGLLGPLRQWACGRVAEVPGPGGDLIAGVVLGDRRRLADTQADADFRTTGLTHLVAVSGSHLVVVAAIVGWLLGAVGASKWLRVLVVGVVVGGYVVLSGVQPSAVRAWVMALAVSAAWFSGRRTDGGSALSVAAAATLLLDPASAFDLGFQLSVAAVAGIVFFARLAEEWLSAALPKWLTAIVAPVALTLAATASTLPLIVGTFGTLSLVSPIANLIVGPAVSAALVIGLAGLAAAAMWAPLGGIVLEAAGAVGGFSAAAAGWLASWPRAAIALALPPWVGALACGGAAAVVWAMWPQPTKVRARLLMAALAVGMFALAVGPPVGSGAQIVTLDVGQGDAILVRDAGKAVLIDTGPSESALRSALGRMGVRSLDAVVITHLHDDHYGGLAALDGLVATKMVCFPAGTRRAQSPVWREAAGLVGEAQVREIQAGDVLHAGRLALRTVWPRAPVEDAATNEASVVLQVEGDGFSALLTGDAENVVLQPLAADGTLGDIDVLKVGHHGSAEAVSPELLRTLRPEWALVSVGVRNRFGHPKRSTMRELADAAARVARTDRVGDITVTIERGAYAVATAHPAGDAEARLGSPPQRVRAHGGVGAPCATLSASAGRVARPVTLLESHGEGTFRVQAGLPDLRGAGDAARRRARSAQAQRRRGCGPRLQHGDVRRGICRLGTDHLGVQHAAVRVRAPPCRRHQRRQDEQGAHRRTSRLRR
jgi:competence protein ComEC